MTNNNKPIDTLRDGRIKATIWRNEIEKDGKKKAFFPVTFTRLYQDKKEKLQDGDSFTRTELLQVQRLAGKAYDRVLELKEEEKGGAQ